APRCLARGEDDGAVRHPRHRRGDLPGRSRGRHDGPARPDPRPDAGKAPAAAARRGHHDPRVHGPQGARARPGARGERARLGGAAPVTALRALRTGVRARRWTVAASTLAVFVAYHALILGVLVAGLGGAPNYLRLYPAWENACLIFSLTQLATDAAAQIARMPLFVCGLWQPPSGVVDWSYTMS